MTNTSPQRIKLKEPHTSVMPGSMMDFDTDRSTPLDRKRVVFSYLLKQAIRDHEEAETDDIPEEMIGSFYF